MTTQFYMALGYSSNDQLKLWWIWPWGNSLGIKYQTPRTKGTSFPFYDNNVSRCAILTEQSTLTDLQRHQPGCSQCDCHPFFWKVNVLLCDWSFYSLMLWAHCDIWGLLVESGLTADIGNTSSCYNQQFQNSHCFQHGQRQKRWCWHMFQVISIEP